MSNYYNQKNDLRTRILTAAQQLDSAQARAYAETALEYARERGARAEDLASLAEILGNEGWREEEPDTYALQAADLASWAAWSTGWDTAAAKRWGKDGQGESAREACTAALVWLAAKIEEIAAERAAAE